MCVFFTSSSTETTTAGRPGFDASTLGAGNVTERMPPLTMPPWYVSVATPASPLSTSASRVILLIPLYFDVPVSDTSSSALALTATTAVIVPFSASKRTARSRASGTSVTTPSRKRIEASSRTTSASGPAFPFAPFAGGASQPSRRVPAVIW